MMRTISFELLAHYADDKHQAVEISVRSPGQLLLSEVLQPRNGYGHAHGASCGPVSVDRKAQLRKIAASDSS